VICGCGQPPAQKNAVKTPSQPVSSAQAEDVVPSKRVVGLIGQGIVDVLMSAKKVEVFRINGESTDADSIEGWKITAKGADRDAAFAKKICNVMFNEKNYLRLVNNEVLMKNCIFQPGVVFRLSNDEGKATLIICFNCDQMRTTPTMELPTEIDFDPGREQFVALAKAAFPNDKVIQGLK
jgi:hypothetical protein